jgi:3-methyl-2-oxobutanoate hydroxymethyltransferase
MMVWTDAFGYTTGRSPKFVRRYADLADQLAQAVGRYVDDVHEGAYPSADESY